MPVLFSVRTQIWLCSKQGQGGTIAVGSGTPFRVQRSRATTVSPADTFDDILVIDANNQTTLPGALSAGGNIDNTSKGKVLTQAIELSFSTPYIDFHFNYSTDDFTGRIMATAADQISVQGSHWRVDRDLRVGGMADIGGWTQCRDDLSANKQTLDPLLLVRWFQAEGFDLECSGAAVTLTPPGRGAVSILKSTWEPNTGLSCIWTASGERTHGHSAQGDNLYT